MLVVLGIQEVSGIYLDMDQRFYVYKNTDIHMEMSFVIFPYDQAVAGFIQS